MSLQCVIVVLLGITNVEEFSLLVEGQKEEKEEVEKTGTLKRVCIHEQVMRYFWTSTAVVTNNLLGRVWTKRITTGTGGPQIQRYVQHLIVAPSISNLVYVTWSCLSNQKGEPRWFFLSFLIAEFIVCALELCNWKNFHWLAFWGCFILFSWQTMPLIFLT